MPGTLKEILQHKQNGDRWYSYIAPEEFHVWQKPWERERWNKYDVEILSVGVSASETVAGTEDITKFSNRNRIYLDDSGVEIHSGMMKTRQKKSANFKFRVDSVVELNTAMEELSKISELKFWQLTRLQISNKKTGKICEFRLHNPDGNGTSFYFWKLIDGKTSTLYPDIDKTSQSHYLGNFKQHFAACECSEQLQKFHGCTLKKGKSKII